MLTLIFKRMRTVDTYRLMKLCDSYHIDIYWEEMLWGTGSINNTEFCDKMVKKLNRADAHLDGNLINGVVE